MLYWLVFGVMLYWFAMCCYAVLVGVYGNFAMFAVCCYVVLVNVVRMFAICC